MPTSNARLRELILYVAQECAADPAFGKTKLYKVLFYTDFTAYARLGHSITEQEYVKFPFGPVPQRADSLLKSMARRHEAAVMQAGYHGREQQRVTALRPPDLSVFDAAELAVVNETIKQLWGRSGKEVSDLSHDFLGWRIAEDREVIPYEMALVDQSSPTEEEEEYGLQLVRAGR